MPTKKPIIQAVVDEEQHKKFIQIAAIEKRSKSQIATFAIEKFIEQYEQEHGEIKI